MKHNDINGCQQCSRREFFSKMGTLMGAAVVMPTGLSAFAPAPVPASAIPSKKGAVKVRLVFAYHLADVQARPDWPNKGFDFRPVMKNMTDSLNAGVRGVEFIPSKASSEEDGQKIAADDAVRGDIAGYMVVQLNCWNRVVLGLAKARKPILYTCMPYGGDGGWQRYSAMLMREGQPYFESIATMNFADVVAMAGAFSKLKKSPDAFVKAARDWRIAHTPKTWSEKAIEGPLECLSPEETLRKVRGMKILSVEKNLPKLAGALKKDFGVDVEIVPFDALNAEWDAADPAEAKALAEDWKNGANAVEDVSDDTLLGCAKLFLGMKALLRKKNAQSITINCLGGCYTGLLKSYPCLGFMQLQDEGFFGTCENDINSNFTMMLFNAFTKGRMGYISDPVLDVPTRSIIYAHCVSTRKYFGTDGVKYPYEILTHSEDREGASVRTLAPVGYPLTTVKMDLVNRRMAVHTAISTGNDPDDRACRTKIVAKVTGDFDLITKQWDTFGWHRVTFFGDFASEVEKLAAYMGYELIRES